CGETIEHKLEDWYQTGYRTLVEADHSATYRDFVREIVTRYRDEPAILAWQLGNEIEIKRADGSCGSSTTLLAFGTDVAGLVKSIDGRHLVSLGTIGSGQCGASGDDYLTVHEPAAIDVCEYHWYPAKGTGWPSFPGDQWNGLLRRLDQAAALGKPLFVGEMGLRLGEFGGDRSARAATLGRVIGDQRLAGVVGHLPWAWCSASEPAYEDFLYQPGDPAIAVIGA